MLKWRINDAFGHELENDAADQAINRETQTALVQCTIMNF